MSDLLDRKKEDRIEIISSVGGLAVLLFFMWMTYALINKIESKNNKKSKTDKEYRVIYNNGEVQQIDTNSMNVADYIKMQKQMEKEIRDIQIEMEREIREMECEMRKMEQEMQIQFRTR